MPKYYCDYCDIFLTHDSSSVRKAHNTGWKHINQVAAYYRDLDTWQTQEIIDNITLAHDGQLPAPAPRTFSPPHYEEPPRRRNDGDRNRSSGGGPRGSGGGPYRSNGYESRGHYAGGRSEGGRSSSSSYYGSGGSARQHPYGEGMPLPPMPPTHAMSLMMSNGGSGRHPPPPPHMGVGGMRHPPLPPPPPPPPQMHQYGSGSALSAAPQFHDDRGSRSEWSRGDRQH